MDPITAIGATAAIAQLVTGLGSCVIEVGRLCGAVRDIREDTRGLRSEIDAFKFQLSVIDGELQRGMLVRAVKTWWDLEALKALLSNTSTTFLRLQTIFEDISRQRGALARPREYYRTQHYDREIENCRLRIQASMSSLQLPVILMNMFVKTFTSFRIVLMGSRRNARILSKDTNQDHRLAMLNDRMSRLEDAISQLGSDLASFPTATATSTQEFSASDDIPVRNIEITQTSQELISVASDLLQNVASVAGTLSTKSEIAGPPASERVSPPSISAERLAGRGNQGQEDEDGISLLGAPLTDMRRQHISSWVGNVPESAGSTPTPTEVSFNSIIGSPSPSSPSTAARSAWLSGSSAMSIYTMPSTVSERDGLSLSHSITITRVKRAKQLMNEGQYQRALPLLTNLVQSTMSDENASDASKTELSHMFSVAAFKTDPLSEIAKSFAYKFPSIQEELAKKLSAKGAALASDGSFAEAEPLVRAGLDHVRHLVQNGKASAEIQASEKGMELQLGESLAVVDCTSEEAESLLKNSLELGSFDGAERSRCVYSLAKMFFERCLSDIEHFTENPNSKESRKALPERHANQVVARDYCLLAAEWRDAAFGREHPATQQAIALMTHIYVGTGESEEADLWHELLLGDPEHYVFDQFVAYDLCLTLGAPSPERGAEIRRRWLDFLTSSYEFCLDFLDVTAHFPRGLHRCCVARSLNTEERPRGGEAPCSLHPCLPAHNDEPMRIAANTLVVSVLMAGSRRQNGAECIAEINHILKRHRDLVKPLENSPTGGNAAMVPPNVVGAGGREVLLSTCLKAAVIAGNVDTTRALIPQHNVSLTPVEIIGTAAYGLLRHTVWSGKEPSWELSPQQKLAFGILLEHLPSSVIPNLLRTNFGANVSRSVAGTSMEFLARYAAVPLEDSPEFKNPAGLEMLLSRVAHGVVSNEFLHSRETPLWRCWKRCQVLRPDQTTEASALFATVVVLIEHGADVGMNMTPSNGKYNRRPFDIMLDRPSSVLSQARRTYDRSAEFQRRFLEILQNPDADMGSHRKKKGTFLF